MVPPNKDYVLRKKLSEATGHYISPRYIGRVADLSRRSIYNRLNGLYPFRAKEIDRLEKFFSPYGVTRVNIIEWIKADNGRTDEADATSAASP